MAKKSFWQRGEDYAQKVSDEIIDQIKRGVAPWQKPWKPGEQISAENFSTGQKYSGGNSLYLMSRGIRDGRGDNRWGTYNQIREAGGQVRKGEKGTQVLFFTDRNSRAAKDEQGKTLKNKEGKTIYEEQKREKPICKQYTVFNVEQAEGLKLKPREDQVRPEWDAHRDAEKVIAANGATVEHVAGDRAAYLYDQDKIVLPEQSQFPTRNGYYQTALHECGHATGHPDRMNRETLKEGLASGFGSPEYAREELRAEISAMMTGERVGVGHDPQRGAAYEPVRVSAWHSFFRARLNFGRGIYSFGKGRARSVGIGRDTQTPSGGGFSRLGEALSISFNRISFPLSVTIHNRACASSICCASGKSRPIPRAPSPTRGRETLASHAPV